MSTPWNPFDNKPYLFKAKVTHYDHGRAYGSRSETGLVLARDWDRAHEKVFKQIRAEATEDDTIEIKILRTIGEP